MLKQYNAVLLELYRAPHQEGGWQTFIESLVAFTQSKSAVLSIQNAQTEEVSALAHTGFDESDLANWQNYYIGIDPWVEGLAQADTNTLCRGDELVDRRIFLKSECANDFTLPLGIHSAVGAAIEQPTNNNKIFFALQQDDSLGSLSKETFHYIQQMIPHIEQAAFLASDTLSILNHNKSLLKQFAQPSFICDSKGHVEEMNGAAAKLLSENTSVSLKQTKLGLANSRIEQRLKKMIVDATSLTDIQAGSFLRLQDATSNFLIKVTPWIDLKRDPFASRLALVMVKSPNDIYPIDLAAMSAFFDLSERESQVAQSIAQGLTAKELALEHNVKESTIRSHIKSILVKTNCRNQIHLVAVLNATRLHQR
ncbi:MAG: DNA-binding CsgD family transcriptional regulator/uncharacterized protein (DUF305 family) [Candidatus Azotimanducaceae bacterium]